MMEKVLFTLQVLVGLLSIIDTSIWVLFYKWFNDSLRKLEPPTPGDRIPDKVLIITPARNEEDNIGFMIESLQKQDYKNYTLVIVDDASTDNTPCIVKKYASRDGRIRYLRIEEIPKGWSPKIYAIIRGLEEHDDGSYPVLVFLDADVYLKKESTLRILVSRAYTYNAIVSMNPRFKCKTLRCQLMETILTTLAHALFGFHQKRTTWFYGCCWAVTREIYYKLGGHRAFYNQIVEDRAIAEYARKLRINIQVINGIEYIETTWYSSIRETMEALQRILAPHIAHTSRRKLIGESILLTLHYAQPLITALASVVNPVLIPIALMNYIIQVAVHTKATRLNKHSLISAFLTPITGQVLPITLFLSKQLRWRGRKLYCNS